MGNDRQPKYGSALGISRRTFLHGALASAAAVRLADSARCAESERPAVAAGGPIIDTHVYVGRWPFRRVAGGEPSDLIALLGRGQVSRAWTGTFEGLLYKDISGANQRLAEACRRHGDGLLVPFGTINPTLPDWEEDLRRCHEVHHMPGIRLHPNYHGYTLADQGFSRVLKLAAARNLIVQLVAWMDDERHAPLKLRPIQVELTQLAEKVAPVQRLRLIVANGFRTVDEKFFRAVAAVPEVHFDFARLSSNRDVSRLLQVVPASHIVFGSFAPLYRVESAARKLRESGVTEAHLGAIRGGTARRLMAAAPR